MATISLADWTCHLNNCSSPIAFSPTTTPTTSTTRPSKHITHSWTHAQAVLRDIGLSFHSTDLSHITAGNVSVAHLLHLSRHSLPPPAHKRPRQMLSNFAKHGFTHLHHFGAWIISATTSLPIAFNTNDLHFPASQYLLTRDWPSLEAWLRSLSSLIPILSPPSMNILLPRNIRQSLAESTIQSLSSLSTAYPHTAPPNVFASDASMISTYRHSPFPSSPHLQQHPSVIFAVVGNKNAFACSLSQSMGRSATIQHGEAYGIVACAILARSYMKEQRGSTTLFSDHLNSVRLVNSTPLSPHHLSSNPARSLYRWLLQITSSLSTLPSSNPPSLTSSSSTPSSSTPSSSTPSLQLLHISAHTTSKFLPACLNRLADHIASRSQNFLVPPPCAPSPTFFMDDYTPYTSTDGFIETNITKFVDASLARLHHAQIPTIKSAIVSPVLYDAHEPPEYPYTRAPSAYSAVIQLYIRTEQLDTALTRSKRLKDGSQPWCRFGCATFETAHHIFVECHRFHRNRVEAATAIADATSSRLLASKLPLNFHPPVVAMARQLFRDGDIWPVHKSFYYHAVLPPFVRIFPGKVPGMSEVELQRIHRAMAAEWHTGSMRLAGRIWGIVRRNFSPFQKDERARRRIELPRHLRDIASSSSPTSRILVVA